MSGNDYSRLSKTRPIHSFTVDKDQNVRMGPGGAHYLYDKHVTDRNVNIDLNVGFDSFRFWDCTGAIRYRSDCRWLMEATPAGSDIKEVLGGADFFCSDVILRKIASTDYGPKNAWSFVAVKRNGVIFLCETGDIENAKRDSNDVTAYWGRKFIQCMRSVEKHGIPNTEAAVVQEDELRVVSSTTLLSSEGTEPLHLVVCGGVDCLDSDGAPIKLKTHALRARNYLRHKTRDTYLQCRLVGVENVVIGARDDRAHVRVVERVTDAQICQRGKAEWIFNDCMNVLHIILSSVRDSLENANGACLIVEKSSVSCVINQKLSVSPTDMNFLSDDFKAHFNLK